MAQIAKITDAYVRHYRDNRQSIARVEWVDNAGYAGQTEGQVFPCAHLPIGTHMAALFARANREGVPIRGETW